ncbi:hypothetical protein M0638_17425 [Roseomonas sp. NAR14]|uniref:Uncharacterized protein n=1 Tax=Roseomonas acroporae TaxID=2937791 RepID=A0A9X1Y952_9PROT|nr:hypothetical protein [Roseomonas acroporae]MCK8786159.1 hypothetical protein [Roseomonas acroporae]
MPEGPTNELDALLDALERCQAARREAVAGAGVDAEAATAAQRDLWDRLTAIVDARVVAALRAAGVARRVGAEEEDRRTAHGTDD